MPDSKAKRGKQDRARVALGQEHERHYLADELSEALNDVSRIGMLLGSIARRVGTASHRLRSGFPAAQKKARRGAR